MQDLLRTRRLEAESLSRSARQSRAAGYAPVLRRAGWHLIGAVALAIAMMAQPVSAATLASTDGPNTMPTSHSTLTSSALPATGAPTQSQFFAPTGRSVEGDFLGAYQRFGLSRMGYPISGEMQEGGLTVQYFERVRMERHPELAAKGYGVLFTRLGAEMTGGSSSASIAPFASTSTNVYFAQTGHSLSEPFLSYWKANGGVELFGYPLSEPVMQDGLKVQWFERARMEYHPELASSGQSVELTLLGSIAYQKGAGNTVQAQQVKAESPAPKAPPASAPAPAAPSLTDKESYLLKSINDQRGAAGLAPVQLNGALTDLARARSTDMATRNYFSHTTPEGTNFLNMLGSRNIPYKFAGEILARNNYPDNQAASTAMTSYLNSAPHKAIIMDGRYSLVGVGYAKSTEDSMNYFTVIFVQQ